MRSYFALLLCTSFCLSLYAQPQHVKVTRNSIVRDSDGMVYPYMLWSVLVKQGDYELYPTNEERNFLLVKVSEQQKNQRFEKMAKPEESRSFRTGKAFGSFKTQDINNNKIDLKEEKGKIVVLNFWFINCPPCRMEIPSLNELVAFYKGNTNVKFIGIALDPRSDLEDFLKTVPFNYTIVHNGRYFAQRYNIEAFPTHVIINQEGKVYFHTVGLAPNTVFWLKKSIDELLSQSSVSKL